MENVLSVRGLTKRYDKFALKDVSFNVRRGEIMGFIGRNGAGKTTTLKSLMNYLHPDAGEIDFFGKPMTGNEMEIKRRTGFVTGGVDYYMRRKLRAITDVTRGFYPNWDEAAYKRCIAAFTFNSDPFLFLPLLFLFSFYSCLCSSLPPLLSIYPIQTTKPSKFQIINAN